MSYYVLSSYSEFLNLRCTFISTWSSRRQVRVRVQVQVPSTTSLVYACVLWAVFVQFLLVRRPHCASRPQHWPSRHNRHTQESVDQWNRVPTGTVVAQIASTRQKGDRSFDHHELGPSVGPVLNNEMLSAKCRPRRRVRAVCPHTT